jgi:hypothetical protein
MLGSWLALVALADGGDGFTFVRDTSGCRISMRPPEDPRGAAMRADCHWPEVPAEPLTRLIGRYEAYPEFVFPLDKVEVRREEAGRTLVYQHQSVFGTADREVLLWMTRQDLPSGGERVSWTAATEEPLQLEPGAVRTPRNTGFWQVDPDPAGGSHVVHEIALDAGGYVPQWLVNFVRTRAFSKILSDLRVFADHL